MKQLSIKKLCMILMPFGILLTAVSFVFSYRYFNHQPLSLNLTTQTSNIETKPVGTGEPPTQLNVLLLGYGGAGHDGGFLTDVIQVVHVDFITQKVAFISIPRDLWVELPSGKSAKINEAFTLGDDPNQLVLSGGEVSKQMASAITGLPIHYFAAIDFVGFQRLIGYTLDGIEIDNPETLDDPWYPLKGEELNTCGMTPEEVAEVSQEYSGFELEKQFECRYEQLHYPQGTLTLEGGDALKYVRSRHGSPGGDFSRSQRQDAVLVGIKKKLASLKALENSSEFYATATEHLTTDLDLASVQFLVPFLENATNFTLDSVTLSTENVLVNAKSTTGQYILLPKTGNQSWESIHQYIQQQLNNEQP